jgi:hypothetical protein
MLQQFFSRDQLADAANLIRRAGQQPRDVWFGVASFTAVLGANKQGQPEYRLERKQDDAQALRAFWYDADIHRPGDNKGPDKAFADEAELEQWQHEFLAVTRLPPRNRVVNSGYGRQLYWVFHRRAAAGRVAAVCRGVQGRADRVWR